jgi:hypothetical protein
LNDDENANFNNFLSGFDSSLMHDNKQSRHPMPSINNQNEINGYGDMPPTFIRSETTMGLLESVPPSELERAALMYGDGLGTRVPGVHVSPASHIPYGNNGGQHGLQDNWSQSLFHQLHSAASANHIQPGYSATWQNQRLQPQNLPLSTPGRGPPMRFGSDAHFQPTGFTGHSLHLPTDPELQTLEWLESAPNTQPNTRPNTTPSSPNWSKKRKLDDYHSDRRNGFYHPNKTSTNHHRSQSSRHIKMSSKSTSDFNNATEHDDKPDPTTLNNSYSDAEAESDDDPTLTNTNTATAPSPAAASSPAPWPKSKARQPKSYAPPTSAKVRKRHATSNSTNPTSTTKNTSNDPAKRRRKPPARTPLTSEQKRTNHTNSEQRRRDATARAYAELYDLVPELKEPGMQKASTMKKLEVVVEKVRQTVGNVEMLRGKLGIPPGGSVVGMMAASGIDVDGLGGAGSGGSGVGTGSGSGMGNGMGALGSASDFGMVNGVDMHTTNGFGNGEDDEGEEWEDEDEADGEGEEWEGSASG